MGKFGAERPLQKDDFGPPTTAVELGMGVGFDGNPITTAGAEIAGIAGDDFATADIAANAVSLVTKRKLPATTIGTARVLLGASVTAGQKGAVQANSKFAAATAGQNPAVIFLEGGADGDLVEARLLPPQRARVASVANADTSGATLGQLETEVNELKALLRAHGLLAT